jgi:hypothetical protein
MNLTPDIETVVQEYLASLPEVEAIAGDRVVLKTPDDTDEPWVRVFQLEAPRAGKSPADYLIAYYLQLDCYSGTAGELAQASLLMRTVRAALTEMHDHDHDGAVVTGSRIHRARRFPDRDFTPPADRYMITATLWAHAVAEVGS